MKIAFRIPDNLYKVGEEMGPNNERFRNEPFIGWGKRYDTWRDFTCPSILPKGSATHVYIEIESKKYKP